MAVKMKYAQVVLPLSSYQAFTYTIPESLTKAVVPGCFVSVPFRNRQSIGVVAQLSNTTTFTGTIKTISGLHHTAKALPGDLWATLEWMSRYYLTPLGLVLKTALPLGFAERLTIKKQLMAAVTPAGSAALDKWTGAAHAQEAILTFLHMHGIEINVSALKAIAGSPNAVCQRLAEKGYITLEEREQAADPFMALPNKPANIVDLNAEQTAIYDQCIEALDKKVFAPFMMRGVTGSGKTEVYLKAAQYALAKGQQVLVLVPEIALTPQVAARFRFAFGNRVALWHSQMNKGERSWTWQELQKGRFDVVIGARSALFAPLPQLGLIIIDEEHDSSFKQNEPAPRYHARDAALVRAQAAQAVVLLSSATPSTESYYNALTGRSVGVRLSQRYGGAVYPHVTMVDLNAERKRTGNFRVIFSAELLAAIRQRIADHEQVILLQNRRGFAPVCSCNECGYQAECPSCSVLLTYHKAINSLKCHYCGYQTVGPEACPDCGSEQLFLHGVGTEQLEELLAREIPEANILRMDSDTTRTRGAHKRILEAFGSGEYNILLGTQMIAKGLDFEHVTLVGVVNADTGLHMPDFRAGERTFQLVYQVCGRSGRRQKVGQAIIQTNHPDDMAIISAAHLDATAFYNRVLAERKELDYPPFSRMIRCLLTGRDQAVVWKKAQALKERLMPMPKGMRLLGPATAPLERVRDNWRVHLLVRSSRITDPDGKLMRRHVAERIQRNWIEKEQQGVRLIVDVDPMTLL